MKNLLFLMIIGFVLFNNTLFAQFTKQERQEIQEVANYLADKTVGCCTLTGTGNGLYATVDWDSVKQNRILGTLIIPITLGWTGGWTGKKYWIKGVFELQSDGKKTWTKKSESKGFPPNCGDCLSQYGIKIIRP